jgi:hypothetical protein
MVAMDNLTGKKAFLTFPQLMAENLHGDIVPGFQIRLLAIKESEGAAVDMHQAPVGSLDLQGQSRFETRGKRLHPKPVDPAADFSHHTLMDLIGREVGSGAKPLASPALRAVLL